MPDEMPWLNPLNENASASKARENLGVAGAMNTDPDREARSLELSKSTGQPVGVVRQIPDEIARDEAAERIAANPSLVEYYAQDPSNALISQDDVDGLEAIGQISDWVKGRVSAISEGFMQGFEGTGELGDLYFEQLLLGNPGYDDRIKELEATYKQEKEYSGVDYPLSSAAEFAGNIVFSTPFMAERATEGLILGTATGAAAGAPVGGVGAAPGAVAGGLAGMGIGAKVGIGEATFRMESGHAVKEFLEMRDEDGNPLPPGMAQTMAISYGVLATGVEQAGITYLQKLLPGAGSLSKDKIKSAVKAAGKDKSFRHAMAGVAAKWAKGTLAETTEEITQEVSQIFTKWLGSKIAESQGSGDFGEDMFSEENFARILEVGKKTAAGASVLAGGGAAGLAVHSGIRAKRAAQFMEDQKLINEVLQNSKTHARSSDHTEKFLDILGLGEDVYLPGDAVAELFQSGDETLGKVGVTPEMATEAKAMGHDIRVKLSSLHANLEATEFGQVAEIMKASPAAMSSKAVGALDLDTEIQHVSELYQRATENEDLFQAQLDRTKQEALAAVQASPKLMAQLDLHGGAEQYVESWSKTVEAFSRRMAYYGNELTETLNKVRLQTGLAPTAQDPDGVTYNQSGDLVQNENFVNWFGDSRVVDGEGKPLVVYHGSTAEIGENFAFAAEYIGQQGRNEGAGFYFTTNKNIADGYGDSGSVAEVYLNIRKPLEYSKKAFTRNTLKKIIKTIVIKEAEENSEDVADGFLSNYGDVRYEGFDSILNEAVSSLAEEKTALDQMGGLVGSGVDIQIVNDAVTEETGFDGVIARGFSDKGSAVEELEQTIYVAFSPTQIKSVYNRGTFDPNDPRILYQPEKSSLEIDVDDITLTGEEQYQTEEEVAGHNTKAEILNLLLDNETLNDDVLYAFRGLDVSKWDGYLIQEALEYIGENRTVEEFYNDHLENVQSDGIKDTLLETFEPSSDPIEWAVLSLGTTEDFNEAGYILPDGRLLDLSGSRQGGGGGSRQLDHRQLAIPAKGNISGSDLMTAFQQLGAIRIDANSGLVDMEVAPTTAQLKQIGEMSDVVGSLFVSLNDGSRKSEFDVQNLDKLEGVIKRFYKGTDFTKDTLFQSSWYFSPLQKAVESIEAKAMPAKDWLNRLRKTQGVKAEELETVGLPEFLELQGGKVRKDDILAFLEQNGVQVEEVEKGGVDEGTIEAFLDDEMGEGFTRDEAIEYLRNEEDDTKYSDYQLPGGENYREVLLTLPVEKVAPKYEVRGPLKNGAFGVRSLNNDMYVGGFFETQEEAQEFSDQQNKDWKDHPQNKKETSFRSSHWDEPNVLAHIRLNEREANGEKVLFVEEIQSDWALEGRKKGFGSKKTLTPEDIIVTREQSSGSRWYLRYKDDKVKIGTPFKSLEEAQEEANELGAERFEIEEQALPDMWAVSTEDGRSDKISVDLVKTEHEAKEWGARNLNQAHVKDSGAPSAPFVTSNAWQTLTLKRVLRMAAEEGFDRVSWINGEQTAERYSLDKKVENITFHKLGDNKYNLFVYPTEGTNIDKENVTIEEISDFVGKDIAEKIKNSEEDAGVLKGNDLKIEAQWARNLYDKTIPNWMQKFGKKYGATVGELSIKDAIQQSLPITPGMREAIMGGLPLFQAQRSNKLGSTRISDQGYLVSLFQGADLSTLLHETGHVFFEEMRSLVESGNAAPQLQKDFGTIQKWLGVSAQEGLTEPQLEKFARGFETYLMEGKAPSMELETAFERFKSWLKEVYKEAKNLNAPLTDEVRRVFDRLLASEEEVESAAYANEISNLSESEITKLGVTQDDRDYLKRLVSAGKKRAEAKLQQARDKKLRKLKKEWEEEAQAELNDTPIYQLRKKMQSKGGGLDLDEVTDAFGPEVAEAVKAHVGVGTVQKEGQSLEAAASEFGFDSPQEMIDQLLESPRRQDKQAQLVETKEAEHDAEYKAEEYLLDSEELAEHIDVMGRYISKALGRDTKTVAKAFAAVAAKRLSEMKLKDSSRTDRFLVSLRAALKAERQALSEGKFQDALEANRRARLNWEFAKQSRAIRDMIKDTKALAKRYNNMRPTSWVPKYRANAIALAHRFGLLTGLKPNVTLEDLNAKGALASVAYGNEQDVDGTAGLSWSDGVLDETLTRKYQDLTSDELEEVANLLKFLRHVGRPEDLEDMRFSGMTKEGTVETLSMPLGRAKERKVFKKGSRLKSLIDKADGLLEHASILLFLMQRADNFTNVGKGGKGVRGPHEELIQLSLSQAYADQMRMSREIAAKLSGPKDQLMRTMTKAPKLLKTNVPVSNRMARAHGTGWTMEEVISLALNRGNSYNWTTVLEGHELTDSGANELLKHLSKEDWAAIQQIWTVIDSYWGAIAETHERLNGFRPKKVEAEQFTTPTGDTLAGGYYPLAFDSRMDDTTAAREELQMYRDTAAAAFSPSVKAGATKARTGAGGKPVRLSLSVLGKHLDFITGYITHAEVIRDINRVFGSKDYAELFKQKLGHEAYAQLKPILKAIARSESKILPMAERMSEGWRTAASIYFLGSSVNSPLSQPLGIFNYVATDGAPSYLRGLARSLGSPKKMLSAWDDMHEMSPYMQDRWKQINREISDLVNDQTWTQYRVFGKTMTDIREMFLVLIQISDCMTTTPMWWGTYNRELKAGTDMEKAARVADEAVAAMQSSARQMDRSALLRDRGTVTRIFTMFFSFANAFQNYQRALFQGWRRGEVSYYDFFRSVMLTGVLPPIAMSVLMAALWGKEPDKEDMLLDLALYQFTGVPVVRDFASYTSRKVQGKYTSDPWSTPYFQAFRLAENSINATLRLAEDMDDEQRREKAAWAAAELLSITLGKGIPVPRIAKRLIEGWRQFEEEDGTLFNIVNPDPDKKE